MKYSSSFNIDSSYCKDGFIYVTCKFTSTITINKFKHVENIIMVFLKTNDLFLQHTKTGMCLEKLDLDVIRFDPLTLRLP